MWGIEALTSFAARETRLQADLIYAKEQRLSSAYDSHFNTHNFLEVIPNIDKKSVHFSSILGTTIRFSLET